MDTILMYILIGLGLWFGLQAILKVSAFYYKAGYDERQKKKEAKRLEKKKWKYSHVSLDNPLLNRLVSNRFIVFKGDLGKGKSILMNLTAHYLWQKQIVDNKRRLRYNLAMKPDYVRECVSLEDQQLLPIYSNLDFTTQEGLKKQELMPFLCLQRRAIYRAVFCIDEISSLFPKEMYQEVQGKDNPVAPLVNEMKELFKKNRHYTDGWILATEQDGEDIFKGFRKNGYAIVTALETIVSLAPRGKFFRRLKNLFNRCLPGLFTVNLVKVFGQQLFFRDKIKTFFKLFLPSYFFFPQFYYEKKQSIHNKTKGKYQRYQTRFIFDGAEYWIIYTNEDIFAYETRAYENEYSSKFNKDGSRKRIYNREVALET